MSNSTQRIWEIISNDITIKKNLIRKLINVRALAKFLIKEYHLKASLDSVITAIRRFESNAELKEHFQTIEQALKGSSVSTRTNIACLTLRENSSNAKYIHKLLEDKSIGKSGSVRISKGSEYLKILVDEDDVNKVKENLSEGLILKTETGMAEIVVFMSEHAAELSGIFARLLNEISAENVSISEVVVSAPEILIYVKKEDLVTAHDALFKLCNK